MTDKPMTPERLAFLRECISAGRSTSILLNGPPEKQFDSFAANSELLAEIDRRGAALEKAEADRDDLQTVFDFQWKANQRAIKAWQEAHPGNDMVWPDRAKMVIWLMEQYAAARAALEKARADALEEAAKKIEIWMHSDPVKCHHLAAGIRSLKEPTP